MTNSTPKQIKNDTLKKSTSGMNSFRGAKTPNPRKSTTPLVYAQKENMPTQTPVKLSVTSLGTPVRNALVPRSFKSPIRKTWVSAIENNLGPLPSFPEHDSTGTDNLQSSQSMPKIDPKGFTSPHRKIVSFSLGPDMHPVPHLPSTPSRIVATLSEPVYMSPKSSTPFRSPTSPGNLIYSPSSKSPGRPISPLDEQRLAQRQKQIDYGYRTVGYLRYRLLVTKDQRKAEHPRTPKKTQSCSKRSWDGQLKKWRRDLHVWDPDNNDAFKALLNSDLVVSIIAANPELAEIVDIVREKMDNPTEDYDDYYDSSTDLNTMVSDLQNGFLIEKKVTPRISGPSVQDDSQAGPLPNLKNGSLGSGSKPAAGSVQNRVARTLVF